MGANETRSAAIKRHTTQLQTQLDQVAAGLAALKSMPGEDAETWLAKLRSADDPTAVLQTIRHEASLVPRISPLPQFPQAQPSSDSSWSALEALDISLGMEHPIFYPLFPIDDMTTNRVESFVLPLADVSRAEEIYRSVNKENVIYLHSYQLCDIQRFSTPLSSRSGNAIACRTQTRSEVGTRSLRRSDGTTGYRVLVPQQLLHDISECVTHGA